MFGLPPPGTVQGMEVVTARHDLPESAANGSGGGPANSAVALMAELSASRIATLTLLLADVEGSVRHWEADKAAAAAALRRLSEIASEASDRHEGVRPVEQGEGDSFVIAFSRPSQAIACALEIQLATLKEPWPGARELRARMALHSGEVEIRDDGRYAGHAFNRSARLRALAHGGQTLVTRATHDLVVDALPEGAFFRDLGEHRLRDLARPERVYQLCHPDLPDQFPALRSLSALPNNLPQQLTSFIGRSAEMAQVRGLLDGARLITLTGAGGCGKTRLALHVAADLLEEFPDGVWWVDLAPVADPAIMPQAVASPMSIREVVGEGPTETLVRALGEQRVLIILDNCEHLVDACSAVASALLQRCPNVSIIATSREPLGVEGETAFRVPSLPVPDRDAVVDPEGLDSMRLFLDRARSVRPNLKTTPDDAERISEICRRLDGIPLAIELAAARIRMLSPAQIADGLTDRFHLLTGGARTALPRQRTLEASVDWSYRLLSEPERVVLGRLSVFAGSFELDAAEDVCSDDGIDRYSVLDLLSGLVDRSLVQIEEEEPRIRYRLLETIRAYARQRLTDSDDAASARSRHLDHYVALAEEAEAGLRGEAFMSWSRRLDAELDNLRAAMEWALSSEQAEKHLRLTSALLAFWLVRGLYSQVRRGMEAALAAGATDVNVRAKALGIASIVTLMAGQYSASLPLAENCVALAREIGDETTLQRGLTQLGWSKFFTGQGGLAEMREAHLLGEPDPVLVLRTIVYRGLVESMLTSLDEGRRHFDHALHRARRSGDLFWESVGGFFAGSCEVLAGRFADAEALLDRSLDASRTLDNKTFSAFSLTFKGWLATYRGDYDAASEYLDEALEQSAEIGDASGEQPVGIRGHLQWATGDAAGAYELLQPSLETWRAFGNLWWVTFDLSILGGAAHAQGRVDEAASHLEEGVRVARGAGFWALLALNVHEQARVVRANGEVARAEEMTQEALRTAAERGARTLVPDCLEVLAGIASDLESYAESARLFGAAQRLRDEIGYRRFPVYQAGYEKDVAAVRSSLEPEEFAERWAEGVAMSLEEAVAYAARGRGERKRPSAGWESLTPTELDVVRLAAQGLSNPEIARKLFIARNTVKVHLSHVFSKLGMTSRAELAAEATRRRI